MPLSRLLSFLPECAYGFKAYVIGVNALKQASFISTKNPGMDDIEESNVSMPLSRLLSFLLRKQIC